jgi:RNA polymerase I-specific transcription initiation factor RRN3
MSFFPFDPYKLPRSSSYIEPIYREWASVAVGADDDEEEEEEDEEEEEEDEVVRAEADGLGASFGEMRISPVPAPPPHGAAVALGNSSIVV